MTKDDQEQQEQIRPDMSIEEQLRELRGAVRMLASIAGPWVVNDLRNEFPYLFMREQ